MTRDRPPILKYTIEVTDRRLPVTAYDADRAPCPGPDGVRRRLIVIRNEMILQFEAVKKR